MYSTTRISAAFALAALVHEKQKRKSTDIPYISHPMAVAAQVSVWGGSEDQFIAALLHDVVEDGGAQYMPVIEEHFGKHVLDLVMACSDAAPQRGQPKGAWIERKEKYIANLRSAADEVLLISAADKWHNLASILADAKQLGEVVFDRFIRQDFERAPIRKRWFSGTTRSFLPSTASETCRSLSNSKTCLAKLRTSQAKNADTLSTPPI